MSLCAQGIIKLWLYNEYNNFPECVWMCECDECVRVRVYYCTHFEDEAINWLSSPH